MRFFLQIFSAIFTLCICSVDACTGMRMTAQDGTSVNGRTVEFGTVIDMHACVIPRKFSFVGKTPRGNGLKYTSKYAVAGVYCFEDAVVMDGVNEKGLACGAFYFPGFASYTPTDRKNQSKALSPVEFPNWILTQFATLAEVKAALKSVVIAPTVIKGWGPTPAPFHYIVYDKQGDALVIEPIDGTLMTYENKIGAFTNSPNFDWHLTNLRNFINLTPFNAQAITLRDVRLAPFGQGSGMVGLPGDFTPPSRFVRAAIFSSTAIPAKNGEDLVGQTFHLLNQFDIPVGVARQKDKGQISTDSTQLTSVKDPNALRYYFKSYDDQTIKWIALNDFDLNANVIKSVGTTGKNTTFDVSASLSPLAN
ncbi:MAG: choloylglycine hydrolase family protein [Chlamydiales bacterium]|nr:choloylglycine hydrolase family protein [Chlamydiales bacterium]